MKINRKLIRKIKKTFNLYNLAIIGCIIIIAIALFIIFKPSVSNNDNNANDAVANSAPVADSSPVALESNVKDIGEDKAKKLAVKQFKKLGEKVKADELNIIKIQRSGVEYYYVTTPNNNLEIRISDGKITRINSAVVEK